MQFESDDLIGVAGPCGIEALMDLHVAEVEVAKECLNEAEVRPPLLVSAGEAR
jgi:hypothetical protein